MRIKLFSSDCFCLCRIVKTQQDEWKRHRWIKIKTKLLKRGLDGQYDLVMKLPEEAHGWDVTMSIMEMINELTV